MIKVVKRDLNVKITQGTSVSGKVVVDVVSTAGGLDSGSHGAGMIKVKKISAQQLRGERLSNLNQRLRGFSRSLVSSD